MKSFYMGNLKIDLPVIQGGMGVGISLSGLASAVANEGGVGVISCAGLGLLYPKLSTDYLKNSILGLREELRKAKEKTNGVIGVNIMVALSNFSDMVKTAISEKADIIFSGAGLPLDLPSYLEKESKTKLVPIVSSSRAAKLICEKWRNNYDYLPDAIVVEGPKAGGHLGYKNDQIEDVHFSLEHILPEVIDEVKDIETHYGKNIPVIVQTRKESTTEYIWMYMGQPIAYLIISDEPIPRITPIIPPVTLIMTASIRNWNRMCRPFAPMDIRSPISRVRSATDTYMMFMIPMPPTSNDMPAIQANRTVIKSVVVLIMELSSSCERTWKSSSSPVAIL